jgi:hypothetical protein
VQFEMLSVSRRKGERDKKGQTARDRFKLFAADGSGLESAWGGSRLFSGAPLVLAESQIARAHPLSAGDGRDWCWWSCPPLSTPSTPANACSEPSNPDEAVTSPLRAAFPPLQRTPTTAGPLVAAPAIPPMARPRVGRCTQLATDQPITHLAALKSAPRLAVRLHHRTSSRGRADTSALITADRHRTVCLTSFGHCQPMQLARFPRPHRACPPAPRLDE